MRLPPFDQDTRLYRGNLHGHSTRSDGRKSIAEVAEFYQKLGYDFIAISDHLWHDSSFAAQSVSDTSAQNRTDFITIPSAELHCLGKRYDQDGLWHIVANNLPLDFAVARQDEDIRQMITRAVETGAYVSIAHPEWHALTSDEAMLASAAHAVEVFNFSCAITSGRGGGIGTADILLHEGKRITLTATDDSHFFHPDYAGGWVMVGAANLTASAITDALKAGRHYASTGAEIHALNLESNQLQIATSPARHIAVAGAGYLALSVHGDNITHAEFDLNALPSPYFRISVMDGKGGMAWSNPYWRDQLI